MKHPLHAEKGAKCHCNCIGLKKLRGPLGWGENFLQPLLSHPLAIEGNGCVDSPLASFLKGSAVNFFLNSNFQVYLNNRFNILKIPGEFFQILEKSWKILKFGHGETWDS